MINILFSLMAKLYKYTIKQTTRLLILLKFELFEDKALVNMVSAFLYFSLTQQAATGLPKHQTEKTEQ